MKYYFFYEDTFYESEEFDSLAEAEAAWDEVAADVASIYGYCDPDRLFLAEADED